MPEVVSPGSAVGSRGRSRRGLRPLWESGYALGLILLDAAVITSAMAFALRLRFGDANVSLGGHTASLLGGTSYSALVAAAAPAWVVVLAASRAYDLGSLGTGSEEFKAVLGGSMRFTSALALGAVATRADVSRIVVGVALLMGTFLLLVGRYAARKLLHRLRLSGRCLHRTVVVGTRSEVTELILHMAREPYAGLSVVGVSLLDEPLRQEVEIGNRVYAAVGSLRGVVAALPALGADTVAVAGTSRLAGRDLRGLAWELEGTSVDLMVSPALTDVTGPRIHIRPVAGLPLLHVEEPTFDGATRVVKNGIDIVAGALFLLALAPAFLVVALVIRWDSPGPAFYRQERVGRDGRPFTIWKFRTMRVGADRELAGLLTQNDNDGPLFKMRQDPRITRVGAFLRRFSLDELPQLLNVLIGSMSLVGPRPPLAAEVEAYEVHVRRRLLVKPGLTGLWQVSGRSDLPWEEAVRLDLYYVENWSVAMDAMILWKTMFTVLRPRGAY